MHDTIPTSEPTNLRAGDSFAWDRHVDGHSPADGWELTYYLRAGATTIEIEATGVDDHFEVRVPAATTEAYAAGQYEMIGRVSKGTDRYTVFKRRVTVEPDPSVGSASFAERMIVKIEAELEARFGAGSNVRRWQQGGREEEYAEEQELRRQLGYYREQVRVERGGPVFVPVEAQFGSP